MVTDGQKNKKEKRQKEQKKDIKIKKKPISVSARKSKGRELQKWVANKISEITGIPCGKDEAISSRGGGQSGTDIVLIGEAKKLFPYSVECKRQEKLNLHDAIKQAKANQTTDTDWLVVTRRSNEEAIITMDADTFFELYKRLVPKKGYFDTTPQPVLPTNKHRESLQRDNPNEI